MRIISKLVYQGLTRKNSNQKEADRLGLSLNDYMFTKKRTLEFIKYMSEDEIMDDDFFQKIDNNIKIGKDSGIIMKYTDAALYEDKDFLNSDDNFYQLIIRCVDKIYDKEEVHDTKNYSLKEIEEYIEDLNVGVFENVRDFLLNQPKLSYTIRYKNSLGNDRTIELNTLTDFFTLR
jgi:hypothetical protein